ncbi:MAG: glycosyltransferase family 39 protein, partial [Chloroflexota bacterium]
TGRWILLAGITLFVVALGASAAMWLPALQFLRHSTRADVPFEFVATGQRLLNYLQTFTPNLLTEWNTEYVGLVTVLLAFFAWFGRHKADKRGDQGQLPGGRAEIVFWSVLGLLAATFALGEEGVLFRLLYHLAPGFSYFRQQERLLGIVSLSWALLAAQGVALWLRLEGEKRRELLSGPLKLALLGLAFCSLYLIASPRTEPTRDGLQWLGQLAILAVAFFLLRRDRGRRLAFTGLIVLLGVDLFLASGINPTRAPGAATDYWQQPAWLSRLEADQRPGLAGRIDSGNQFDANVGEVYGLEDIWGISPLRLQITDAILALPERIRWQLLDVEHVISPEPPSERATLVTNVDRPLQPSRQADAGLYRLQEAPPGRAWLSYRLRQVAGPQDALQQLAEPDFDATSEVVLHTQVEGLERVRPPDGASPAARGMVAVRRIQANGLEIDVETETDALLVIGEWRYPGWQATLDGNPAPLYAANYAFQALVVPPGRHTVVLRFLPVVVFVGVLLSGLSFAAALVVARTWRPRVTQRERSWRLAPDISLPAPPAGYSAALHRLSSIVAAHSRLLLWGLILLAAGLRLFNLGVQELRGDEAFSFVIASRPLADVIPTLLEVADPHPPLHYLLLSSWLPIAGDSEFAMRVLPALGSLLLIPLVYRLGKQFWSRSEGLLLAFFVTISQSQVWLSQDARSQYVLALLFCTLATLLLVRAARQMTISLWALYVLVALLAMYSHHYSLFALLAHGLYVLSLPRYRRRLAAGLASGLIVLALYLPWVLAFVDGWSRRLSDPGPIYLSPFLMVMVRELLGGPAMADVVGPWVILGATLLCVAGWLRLWRRQRPWAALLGGWLAAVMFGAYLLQLRRVTLSPFYITVAAPAWWALFVAGLQSLWRRATGARNWRRTAAVIIALTVIGLNTVALARYWGDPYEHGRSRGYRPFAEYLAATVQVGDVFLANFPDPTLTYYLRDVPVAFELQPAEETPTETQVEAEMSALAQKYNRLWFAFENQSHWDADNLVFRWLDYHLLLEQRLTFEEVTLEGYRPLHSIEELLLSPDDATGDRAQLDGVYLTVNGLPVPMDQEVVAIPAGSELNVSLLWQTLEEAEDSYTVFVHVLDRDGQLIAQHDGVPAYGTRPTDTWQVGERILDEHEIPLPQEVEGRWASLLVGLYEPQTGERQRFEDGAEAITLMQFYISSSAPVAGGP